MGYRRYCCWSWLKINLLNLELYTILKKNILKVEPFENRHKLKLWETNQSDHYYRIPTGTKGSQTCDLILVFTLPVILFTDSRWVISSPTIFFTRTDGFQARPFHPPLISHFPWWSRKEMFELPPPFSRFCSCSSWLGCSNRLTTHSLPWLRVMTNVKSPSSSTASKPAQRNVSEIWVFTEISSGWSSKDSGCPHLAASTVNKQ